MSSFHRVQMSLSLVGVCSGLLSGVSVVPCLDYLDYACYHDHKLPLFYVNCFGFCFVLLCTVFIIFSTCDFCIICLVDFCYLKLL